MNEKWWLNEVNLVTLGLLSGNEDKDKTLLDFYDKIGARVADRGYVYPHFSETMPIGTTLTDYYHKHGLYFTSFTSVGKWKISDTEALIAAAKIHVDDGADGIHFDMFFMPEQDNDRVPAAVAEIFSKVRQYAKEKYNRIICFAGNEWVMENRTALTMAKESDVVWIESYAYSALEIVRAARLGRAIGGTDKPVWYHWQPEDDAKCRIDNLKNLPKSMFSACLFENALFLCNPQYPVFDTMGEDKSQEFLGKFGKWYIIPINDGWRESLFQYTEFLRTYKDYYIGANPKTELLLAFTPTQINEANQCMDLLLAEGISYQPYVYGEAPHGELNTNIKTAYQRVLVLGETIKSVDDLRVILSILKEESSHIIKFETIEKVIAGVMVKDSKTLIHLLHYGYTDSSDSLESTEPIHITIKTGKINNLKLVSPDMKDEMTIPFTTDGELPSFTIPGLTYYSLVILEGDQEVIYG